MAYIYIYICIYIYIYIYIYVYIYMVITGILGNSDYAHIAFQIAVICTERTDV